MRIGSIGSVQDQCLPPRDLNRSSGWRTQSLVAKSRTSKPPPKVLRRIAGARPCHLPIRDSVKPAPTVIQRDQDQKAATADFGSGFCVLHSFIELNDTKQKNWLRDVRHNVPPRGAEDQGAEKGRRRDARRAHAAAVAKVHGLNEADQHPPIRAKIGGLLVECVDGFKRPTYRRNIETVKLRVRRSAAIAVLSGP